MLAFNKNMKLSVVQFKMGLKVKGIICSQNHDPIESANAIIDVGCDTMPYSNLDFDGPLFTNYNVKCPNDCAKAKDALVFGS
jgi:hypothetical protein